MTAKTDESDGVGVTLALAFILSVSFFFGSYITCAIIGEILGRRGLPMSPVLWAVALYPAMLLIVRYEDRVQRSPRWPTVKKFWYSGITAVASGVPIVLAVVAPMMVWTSLPQGGSIGVTVTTMVAVAVAVLLRGTWAARNAD